MNPVSVRPAAVDDCAALAKLITQLGYPTDAGVMRRRYAHWSGDRQGIAMVAEHQGSVCGMVGVEVYRVWHRDEVVGHIGSLVVDEAVRSQGVGAQLLAAAEQWLREHGARHVILTSALHREDAHRFYLRHGYALTGQRFAKKL